MKILIVGATGMVGRGVLQSCLGASDVSDVILFGRTKLELTTPKLRQLIQDDLFDLRGLAPELKGIDACFFCLGVSSSGMREADYRHITYDLTLAVATQLARLNPAMVFTYVSGAGTDSSERGRTMWARVKGQTENALNALPIAGVYLFRPAIIQPLHGIESKTPSYRRFYQWTKPLLPLVKRLFPQFAVTTEDIGQAMLNAVRRGAGRMVLESRDIGLLARDGH